MFRYVIIIAIFIILTGYVLYKAHIGEINARFRTIALVLLSLLLLLSGIGLYSNVKYYSVDSPEQDFASNKQEILSKIKNYYENQDYAEARKLGEKYSEVRDEDLRHWYEKSLQKELEKKARRYSFEDPGKAISIYKRLWELTFEPEYRKRLQELQTEIKIQEEKFLLDRLSSISRARIGARFWIFRQLLKLYPENNSYKEQYETLQMKMSQRIRKSPWTGICSSSDVSYCANVGMLAVSGSEGTEGSANKVLGDILGVTWRPRGTLINRSGSLAPENAYYYLIDKQESIFLQKCSITQVRSQELLLQEEDR